MMLGNAAADVRLIVWCHKFSHQVEPTPPKRLRDTVPKQLWLAGAIVWCARIATATKSNGGLHQDLLGPYVRPT